MSAESVLVLRNFIAMTLSWSVAMIAATLFFVFIPDFFHVAFLCMVIDLPTELLTK